MLQGHHAEIWCLCVSSTGNVLATGSHDKSLRLWQKTHEPLILQEEREMVCLLNKYIVNKLLFKIY